MPLIPCPVCDRQISTEAEACPQCGHPNRPPVVPSKQPGCYACNSAATTRCQSCGALSCALHLQSIYVRHGRGGGYELRCKSCYSSAQAWQKFGLIVFLAIALFIVTMFLTFAGAARGPFPF
jgi:hypothetical protein